MSAVITPYLIRPVQPDDFTKWKELWDAYNTFYGRAGQTALAPDITEATWGRFFEPHESMHALVAESNTELLGIAHFLFHRSTIQLGPTCYMQDLFIVESARGKGIGRALIHAVYERAKEAGSERVYWQTHETNHDAMKLYDKVAEKSGFIVYRKIFRQRNALEG
jgi:GNAT superfamily N-acetyltransferase